MTDQTQDIQEFLLREEVQSKAEKNVLVREVSYRQDASEILSENSEKASWKPWSFHPCFILVVIGGLHVVQLCLVCWVFSMLTVKKDDFFIFGDNTTAYFAWRFLPIMSAVLLGLLWGIVNADVRSLEPFYQMSLPDGATTEDSISLDYASIFNLFVPYVAFSRRHYGVGISSAAYLLAAIVLPIAHGHMWDVEYKDEFTVRVNMAIVFIVLGLTLLMIVLAIIIAWILRTRKYGLTTDPAGLAGLAALVYDSDVLPLFYNMPVYQTQAFIDEKLKNHRFRLRHELVTRDDRSSAVLLARICTVDGGDSDADKTCILSPSQHPDIEFRQSRFEAHPWKLWGRFLILPSILLLGPYIALRVALWQAQSSGTVWSPNAIKSLALIMTTISTIAWTGIDEGLRLIEPWRQLATDKPRIKRTEAITADYDSMNTVSRIFCGHAFVAAVSFGCLTSQITTIVAPALLESIWEIAYSDPTSTLPQTLSISAVVLRWVTYPLGILNTVIELSLYTRRRPVLPRKPSTLSSKILYICRSQKLLQDVHEAVASTAKQTARNLKAGKKEYRFGWFAVDRDTSRLQLGAEREPVLLPYSYGHNHVVNAGT